MITLNIFLVLLVLAIAFFVFFKLLKGVVKALIAVLFLILFVLAIFGVVIYIDVTKLKGSFSEDQTILLSHKGSVAAGFIYSNSKDTQVLESEKLQLLTSNELLDISRELNGGDYNKDSKGLTLVVDSSYFTDKPVELMEGKSIIIDEQILDDIFTCEKLSDCTSALTFEAPELKKQIAASFKDEQDVKNKLFYNLFVQETKETKGSFLITGIREDKVTIYPELSTIKLIKIIPDKIINLAIKKSLTDADSQFIDNEEVNNSSET